MANPLKILTQLSASKEAQFADVVEMQKTVTVSGEEAHLRVTGGGEISGSGAFKAAGAAQLGSTLAVAGNANLASALDVKGAAALSGSLGVVGAVDLQGALVVAGNADLNGQLDVQGSVNFQDKLDVSGDISGSASLTLGNSAIINGALQVNQNANIYGYAVVEGTFQASQNATMLASASVGGDLSVANDASVGGDLSVSQDANIGGNLTVTGDLFVQGNTTSLATSELFVEDKLVLIASSSMPNDAATADGAGISVMGASANKEFKWAYATEAWTSTEHVDLAPNKVYKIEGTKILEKHPIDGARLSLGDNPAGVAVTSNVTTITGDGYSIEVKYNGIQLNGNTDIMGDLYVNEDIRGNATLEIEGAALLKSDVGVGGTLSASGNISGSAGLDVMAASRFHNTLQVDQALTADSAVVINTFNAQGNADFDLAVNIDGNLSVANIFSVNGGTNEVGISAPLGVNSTAMFNSDATFMTNVGVGGNFEVWQTANLRGNAEVSGQLTGSGGMDLSGGAHIAGQVTMDNDLTLATAAVKAAVLQGSVLNVRADFIEGADLPALFVDASAAYLNVPLNVDSTVYISSIASFASDITASAGLDVALASHFAGDVVVDSELKMASSTARISTVQASGIYTRSDFMDPQSGPDFAVEPAGLTSNIQATFNADVAVNATASVSELHATGNSYLDGALLVGAGAEFQSDVAMDAALNLSGSAFVNITTPVVAGKYNVNDAIRALDAKAGQQASDINTAYANLRYLDSGNFDAQGMKTFVSQFLIADIEKVTVDVLVKAQGTSVWTNDLVSVQVKAGGAANGFVAFEISAPAMGASDSVRIIAVKEQGNLA